MLCHSLTTLKESFLKTGITKTCKSFNINAPRGTKAELGQLRPGFFWLLSGHRALYNRNRTEFWGCLICYIKTDKHLTKLWKYWKYMKFFLSLGAKLLLAGLPIKLYDCKMSDIAEHWMSDVLKIHMTEMKVNNASFFSSLHVVMADTMFLQDPVTVCVEFMHIFSMSSHEFPPGSQDSSWEKSQEAILSVLENVLFSNMSNGRPDWTLFTGLVGLVFETPAFPQKDKPSNPLWC